jgi:hypothetical protein
MLTRGRPGLHLAWPCSPVSRLGLPLSAGRRRRGHGQFIPIPSQLPNRRWRALGPPPSGEASHRSSSSHSLEAPATGDRCHSAYAASIRSRRPPPSAPAAHPSSKPQEAACPPLGGPAPAARDTRRRTRSPGRPGQTTPSGRASDARSALDVVTAAGKLGRPGRRLTCGPERAADARMINVVRRVSWRREVTAGTRSGLTARRNPR